MMKHHLLVIHTKIYQIRESFLELKSQMQNKRTDNLLKTINTFLDEENENCENPVTITQLLGYLIHRVHCVTDKKTVWIGMDIYKQHHTRKQDFSTKDAVTLMDDLTLTKTQLRVLKAYLADKRLFFPNSNDLLAARRKLRPVIRVELNVDSMVKGTCSANCKVLFQQHD